MSISLSTRGVTWKPCSRPSTRRCCQGVRHQDDIIPRVGTHLLSQQSDFGFQLIVLGGHPRSAFLHRLKDRLQLLGFSHCSFVPVGIVLDLICQGGMDLLLSFDVFGLLLDLAIKDRELAREYGVAEIAL